MSTTTTLHTQTKDAYNWISKLVDAIPKDKWFETPDVIESNVCWQVGHLILSFNYHTVMVVVGPIKDVMEQIPMKEYNEKFGYGTDPRNVSKDFDIEQLKFHFQLMQEKSLGIIASIKEQQLAESLLDERYPHPIAKNKFEAIDWNIKHTMWHCGQLALIKRVVDERHDFGLLR